MKLIFAVVSSDDTGRLVKAINKEGHSVTKLATTGGFLHVGNTTLMIGVEEEKVQTVMDIIKDTCKTRTQITTTALPVTGMMDFPIEVEVGGAVVFVMDVERFEKI